MSYAKAKSSSEPHCRVSQTELFVKKKFELHPIFQKPLVLGHYCLDSNRRYQPNASLLKYLYFKEEVGVNFDLNEGLSKHVPKDESLDEKLDNIFSWLLRNEWYPIERLNVSEIHFYLFM